MNHVQPLDADTERAFRLARLVAVEQMPYFARALFAVYPVAAPRLGTMAVDRYWRLYIDPKRLIGDDPWSTTEAAGVLLHEVGHLVRDHADRATNLPQPFNSHVWNLAADAEINDDLAAAGTVLPEGIIYPSTLGADPGDLAENYYAHLLDTFPAADLAAAAGDGCGSGAGTGILPVEAGQPTSDTPGLSAAEGNLTRRQVAHDVTAHAARDGSGRGTAPAGISRWATDLLRPPTVPWKRVLRGAIRHGIDSTIPGRTNYTYRRPSRRRVPGVIRPAMTTTRINVAVIVDTSGSMSADDLAAALSEIDGVLRTAHVQTLTLITCDAATAQPQRVRRIGRIALKGGGGTDMRVGIAAAEALRPRPHLIVVLTDGYTPWPETPIDVPLVCGIIRDGDPTGTPAWATTVHIPKVAA